MAGSRIFDIVVSKGQIPRPLFWRKAQNLRAETVLGMRIEILIFAIKNISLRQ